MLEYLDGKRFGYEPNLSLYKYSNILKPSYLSDYEDGTDSVFRNVGI